MEEFKIPAKIMRLVRMTLKHTFSNTILVKQQQEFLIQTGRGDPLSVH